MNAEQLKDHAALTVELTNVIDGILELQCTIDEQSDTEQAIMLAIDYLLVASERFARVPNIVERTFDGE